MIWIMNQGFSVFKKLQYKKLQYKNGWVWIFSNYWMRLSRIWRILQVKEGSASVDNTLRDLQNSSYPTKAEFTNCFIIHSKYFLLLKGVLPLCSLFFRSPNITQPCPQVFLVNGSIICSGLHFDIIDSIWWRFFPNLVNSSWLYGELCMWF